MGRAATDKRDRLVAAAASCFHQAGFARTSLADVAATAGIAPGNVFYYFKTKDDLARAVVDDWCRQLTAFMAMLETDDDPWERLERFVEQAGMLREMYVSLGCPLAGLVRDLRRESDALQSELPRVYAIQYRWVAARFVDLGFASVEADRQAHFLMASYHGMIHLAYAQGDDGLIDSGTSSLRAWLRQLRATSVPKARAAPRKAAPARARRS